MPEMLTGNCRSDDIRCTNPIDLPGIRPTASLAGFSQAARKPTWARLRHLTSASAQTGAAAIVRAMSAGWLSVTPGKNNSAINAGAVEAAICSCAKDNIIAG